MYEKPQYLTPGGLKRLKGNPFRLKREGKDSSGARSRPQRGISDKSARLIAEAIRTMLHTDRRR